MDHAFNAWLYSTVPPGQYNNLTVTLNTLRDLFGPEIDELGINIVARVGYDDVFSSIDRLTSDCLEYIEAAARLFGITLNRDIIGREKLPHLTTLMRGLLTIDQYEFSHALKGIIEGDFNKEEMVAELVAEIMLVQPEDVLELIQDVPDALISRIREEVNARYESDIAKLDAIKEAAEDFTSIEDRKAVLDAIALVDEASPMSIYVGDGGLLGLSLEQYVKMFGHYISNQKSPKEIARSLMVLGVMAKIETSELLTQLSTLFDSLIGDIHRIMATRKELSTLLTTK